MSADRSALEASYRAEWPRVLAALIRYTGSIELAEDAVHEAVARALASRDPELVRNPGAWLTTVAKRIAIDVVRRDAALRARHPLLAGEAQGAAPDSDAPGGDDRVGLLLLACAPELPVLTRVALALRFVCGVRTEAIADALFAEHTAMSARLTRAKRVIEQGDVKFPEVRDAVAALDDRLDAVLATVSVLYTTGHTALAGDELGSREVTSTAIELARALQRLRPDDPEVLGLLGLLLLTEARAGGRVDADGSIVTLEGADRSDWDAALIREGLGLAARALPGGGALALQAGIAGLHSQAPSWTETDWPAVLRLHDRLVEVWPAPSAELARIVAIGFTRAGPVAALAALDELEPRLPATIVRRAVAVRADLLRRMNRPVEARAAYERARALERNGPVRDFYARRIREMTLRDGE